MQCLLNAHVWVLDPQFVPLFREGLESSEVECSWRSHVTDKINLRVIAWPHFQPQALFSFCGCDVTYHIYWTKLPSCQSSPPWWIGSPLASVRCLVIARREVTHTSWRQLTGLSQLPNGPLGPHADDSWRVLFLYTSEDWCVCWVLHSLDGQVLLAFPPPTLFCCH